MDNRILIVALLLALIFVSYKLARASSAQPVVTSAEDVVYENILTRASVRTYLDKPVDSAKIERLLRAGMAAPSAADKRPWHFVVVTDRELLDGLAKANPNAGFAKKAPLAIVVCGDMNKTLQGGGKDFWIQDVSAVSENILLAAHAMGLGAVWTGTYPAPDRCKAVAEVLGLPKYLVPFNTIVIGYPASQVKPKDKWDERNVTYNKVVSMQ
jgi:nitroreductase